MARKETIKKGTTKDNYVIKNIFDENGKDFKTELKEIIIFEKLLELSCFLWYIIFRQRKVPPEDGWPDILSCYC